jgi:hypothetical protein
MYLFIFFFLTNLLIFQWSCKKKRAFQI